MYIFTKFHQILHLKYCKVIFYFYTCAVCSGIADQLIDHVTVAWYGSAEPTAASLLSLRAHTGLLDWQRCLHVCTADQPGLSLGRI